MTGKKRTVLIAAAVVLVLGGGGGYYAYASKKAADATSSYVTGEARIGDVVKMVSATGTIQDKSMLSLSFGTAGRLAKLNVQAGTTVKKGDVLAELDKSTLQNQVASSRANLKSAEAKLASLQTGASAADLASLQAQVTRAQADLENAKRSLDQARQNVNSSYLQQQVSDAANQLATAQAHFDAVNKTGDSVQIAMAKAQLDQATKNYSTAIGAQSNTSQAQSQVQAAENSVRTAQASYDSAVAQVQAKQQPPSAADIAQAQASVEQAQASLATAENNLAQGSLTAPFDGVVVAVTPHEGEQVSANTVVMSLQSTDTARQLVVPVDEADIGQIKIGQTATITADSMPGKKFNGTVQQVAAAGTTQSNVTTFPVTLSIEGDTSDLKIGQSLNANIVIDKRTGVLTVPSEAIRGVGSRHAVTLYTPGAAQQQTKPVETGLDDGMNVEIVSGLTAGQKIVLGTKSSGSSSGNTNMRNPLGGLGGGGNRSGLTGGGGSNRGGARGGN